MNKKAFKEFEISKSKLDQIKAGYEEFQTQGGTNPSTGRPVTEYIYAWDDGTWLRLIFDENDRVLHWENCGVF